MLNKENLLEVIVKAESNSKVKKGASSSRVNAAKWKKKYLEDSDSDYIIYNMNKRRSNN